MNNKAHLRPKDFDSSGDIIPMACKEEKGDLISRSELIKALHNFFDGKVIDEPTYILRDVFCYIDGAPAVGPKHAEWIQDNLGDRFCSECRGYALYHELGLKIESRFCPNCGADMRNGGTI